MITIDEAIEKYKCITNTDENCPRYCMRPCDKCVQECKQIVEWLELLKWYEQSMENIPSESGVLPKDIYWAGYNKAVDDFAEHIRAYYALKKEMGYVATTYDDLIKYIFELAQQLKIGGLNE